VRNSNWQKLDDLPELQLFKKVAYELTVKEESTIVLKGSRIVVPENLREKAVSIAHE
jgi:predicted DNA binding CopG/RHH family protein